MPITARTPLGAAAVALLSAGTALADVGVDQIPASSPFEHWRAGAFAAVAASSDLDAVATLGVGVYPWRSTGFELRLVYTGTMAGSYSRDYPSGAVVVGSGPGRLSVGGVTTEVAVVTRLDGFEPWAAVGAWSGSAIAETDGFEGISACQVFCQPLATSTPGSKHKVSLGTLPSAGVGVRYQNKALLFGIEARRIFFGRKAARIDAVGLDVPLRGDFLGLSVGLAFGGPVERGQ